MTDFPKITGGSSSASQKLPQEIPRNLIDNSEDIAGLSETILRRLSNQEVSNIKEQSDITHSWTHPEELRKVEKIPGVDSKWAIAKKTLANPDFNAQMKTIGMHRKG